MTTTKTTVILVLAAFLACGCVQPPPQVPGSVAQYEALQKSDPQRYSQPIILLHNLQRVMDADLKPADRLASLQLVTELGGDDANTRTQLAGVLADPRTGPEVSQAILALLLKNDHPDLAGLVVAALGDTARYGPLHDSILDWLVRHPTPAVLSELVRLWANEDPSGPNEQRYRQVVQKLSGAAWDEALLGGINTTAFTEPGSAMAVLVKRIPEPVLRQRLADLPPRTEAISALQVSQQQFDYLPAGAVQFAGVLQFYQQSKPLLYDASRLVMQWRDECGYAFDPRDFHLISRLAQDPLRTSLKRTQLVQELGSQLNARRHVRAPSGDDSFRTRVDSLTMADLWNLYLLSDLLSRPRTQMAVWVLSEGDRADRNGAWGGLVAYRAGQAEATKYPSVQQPGLDDMTFVPAPNGRHGNADYDFAADQRDSLCRFVCHFEKLDNAARAGPTAAELKDAKAGNYCGLVLTSLGAEAFCAHYFNPQGVIISLGVYVMKKPGEAGTG